jgi:hypothetical protein
MANFTRVESPAEKRLKKTAKDLEKARGLSRLSPHGEGAKEAREAYRQGGQPTVNLPTLFGDQPSSSGIPSFRSQPPAVPPTSAGTRFTDLEAFAPAQAPRPSIGTRFTDLEAFAPPTIETKEERKTRFQNEMGARRDVEWEQIRGFSASGGQSGRVAFKKQIELGTRLFEAEDRRQNPGDQPAFGFDTAPEQLEDVLAEVAAQGGPQQLLNALGLIETIDQSGISLFLSFIPGPQRERAREMREAGFGTFEAAMRAYDEIPRKARVRLAEELLFSPLNLLPVIGFPAALAKGTTKAMQTLRRVGQAIIDDTGKPVAQTLRRVGQPTTDALRTTAAPGVPRMADDLGPIGFEDVPGATPAPAPTVARAAVEAPSPAAGTAGAFSREAAEAYDEIIEDGFEALPPEFREAFDAYITPYGDADENLLGQLIRVGAFTKSSIAERTGLIAAREAGIDVGRKYEDELITVYRGRHKDAPLIPGTVGTSVTTDQNFAAALRKAVMPGRRGQIAEGDWVVDEFVVPVKSVLAPGHTGESELLILTDGLQEAGAFRRATPPAAPATVARAAVGPREQNFAQFLRERGVTDPGLDHGPQSPAGRISAAAKRAFDKRRDAEFARFGEAQDEYQQLVNDGSIVDPSGMVRPVAQADPNIAKAALLRQRADELERLADGGMRPRVNRAEAAKIRAEAEALEPTAVPGAVPGAAKRAATETAAEAPPSAAATVVEPAFDDLTPWYKVDFSAAESSDDLANGYASRAIWDVTTPRKRPPTVQAAERARGQAARALGSYPDVPPILARRGEVEAFLATQGKGMGDIDVAAQQVMAARTFLEGRYRSAKAGWERVVRNAEEAVKRARAELGQATEATVEAAPRDVPGAAGTPTRRPPVPVGGETRGGAARLRSAGERREDVPPGEIRDALPPDRPPGVPTSGGVPSGGGEWSYPSEGAENIFAFRPIRSGLTNRQALANFARRTLGKPINAVEDNAYATPAMAEMRRAKAVIASKASRFAAAQEQSLSAAFKPDQNGRIQSLAGIDLPTAPTIQDVAARLPRYASALTPEQSVALASARREMAGYGRVLREAGLDINTRSDIIEGGFYLPRGNAMLEGTDAPVKIRAGGAPAMGGQKGFEKSARFDSMAEGLDNGWEYTPIGSSLEGYANDVGAKGVQHHLVTYFKNIVDPETGLPFAQSAADRVAPALRAQVETLRASISGRLKTLRRQATRARAEGRAAAEAAGTAERGSGRADRLYDHLEDITDIAGRPLAGDTDEAIAKLDGAIHASRLALRDAERAAMRAKDRHAVTEIRRIRTDRALDQLMDDLGGLRGEWDRAKRIAMQTPRDRGTIGISGLQGDAFPDAITNAANKVLRLDQPGAGPLTGEIAAMRAFNDLYRGMGATADNSFFGIQGLFYGTSHPVVGAKAVSVGTRAWFDPQVLGKSINVFDKQALAEGRATSDMWVTQGMLHIGGIDTEYFIGRGVLSKIQNLPVIKQANRAFGFAGDKMRLEIADVHLRIELSKGRTLNEIIASGDFERIGSIANKMTGWSERRFGGAAGDFLLFAPRFFQSRLETTARAGMGLLPGASIDSRVARASMIRFLGIGSAATFGLNAALGNETDFRPIVNGRYNSNFMRIRFGGRDWSLFGTWDSLLRLMVSTATGDPLSGFRGMSSGIVSTSWDLISGEDWIGSDVRSDPETFVKYILSQFIPFSTQELPTVAKQVVGGVREGDVGQAVAGSSLLLGEFHGVKSSPLSYNDDKEIVSAELYGKKYEDLDTDERREVNADDRLVERRAEFDDDAGTPEQQVEGAFANWERKSVELESSLRLRLNAGLRGNDLRGAVQDFKRDRRVASSTVLDAPDVVAALAGFDAKRTLPKEVLARRYWEVDAPIDPDTGEPDFRVQDSLREGILREADTKAGDDAADWRHFITDTGEGTFRGKRFDDPLVRRIVEQYEADMDLLEPFFEAGRDFELPNYESQEIWFAWLDATLDDRREIQRQQPWLRTWIGFRDTARDQMRSDTERPDYPAMDVARVRWWGATPLTGEGVDAQQTSRLRSRTPAGVR